MFYIMNIINIQINKYIIIIIKPLNFSPSNINVLSVLLSDIGTCDVYRCLFIN
jgi:hypothetical protein